MSEDNPEVLEEADLNAPIEQQIAKSSPIAGEPLIATLDELFVRDPLSHSAEERERLLQAMREGRKRWFAEEEAAAVQGRKPNFKKKGVAKAKDLTPVVTKDELDELDIQL